MQNNFMQSNFQQLANDISFLKIEKEILHTKTNSLLKKIKELTKKVKKIDEKNNNGVSRVSSYESDLSDKLLRIRLCLEILSKKAIADELPYKK